MTDDERMDRARRIREMREGSRPQDEGSNDDQQPTDASDGTTSPAASDGDPSPDGGESPAEDSDVASDEAESADTESSASGSGSAAGAGNEQEATEEEATEETEPADTGDGNDDDGTIHIPGAEIGDVDVDVEEMAREAGLQSADVGADDESDDGDGAPAATGAVGRADDSDSEAAEETRVLEFTLGTEQYCLDIEYVEEIVKQESVTRVPNTPDCVEGVVDLRGQITTILDPKVLLDIPEAGSKDLIIVFDPEEFDDQGAVGWVVDDVNQVTPITEDEVNASPVDQDHVNGVVDRDGEFVIWTTPELDLDEVAG